MDLVTQGRQPCQRLPKTRRNLLQNTWLRLSISLLDQAGRTGKIGTLRSRAADFPTSLTQFIELFRRVVTMKFVDFVRGVG